MHKAKPSTKSPAKSPIQGFIKSCSTAYSHNDFHDTVKANYKEYVIINYKAALGDYAVGEITCWLDNNVGVEDLDWSWRGFCIIMPKNELASMFRLKFGI